MPSPAPSPARSLSPVQSPATSKVKKTKKPKGKVPFNRPTTLTLVVQAIEAIKDRKGASAQAIRKFIEANYHGIPDHFLGVMLKRAFAGGLKKGILVRPKGSTATGANGRFRVGKIPAPKKKGKKSASKAKTVQKKSPSKVKKMKKAKSIKKTSTKKRTKPTKKVAKKTKPTKKSSNARPMKSKMVQGK